MSIDISEVNVGDKVKLTRGNGDEAIFTVEDSEGVILHSRNNSYRIWEMDTLEILEKKFELVPGLYSNGQGFRTVSTQDGEQYFTCANGSWVKSTGVKGTETYNAVRQLGTWKRDITF